MTYDILYFMRKKLTLWLEDEFIYELKIQAAKEKLSTSKLIKRIVDDYMKNKPIK